MIAADVVVAQIPEWVWKALVGGAATVIAWFAKRELERIHAEIKGVRDLLEPLKTDVAQLRGMSVGTDRRLGVLETQATFNGQLREADLEYLRRHGKER